MQVGTSSGQSIIHGGLEIIKPLGLIILHTSVLGPVVEGTGVGAQQGTGGGPAPWVCFVVGLHLLGGDGSNEDVVQHGCR